MPYYNQPGDNEEPEELSMGTMFSTAWYLLPMTLLFLLLRSALVAVLLPKAGVWGETFTNVLFWGAQLLVALLIVAFYARRKRWGIAIAAAVAFLLPFARGLFQF